MFKSGLPCFGSYHSGIIFLIAAQPKSILNFLRRVIPFSEYTKAAGFLLQKPAGVDAFLVLFQALTQNPAWISGHPPGRSAQVLAVALDDLFVPPEAVLAVFVPQMVIVLYKFSTFCSFDAGFPHLCTVNARKRAAARYLCSSPFGLLHGDREYPGQRFKNAVISAVRASSPYWQRSGRPGFPWPPWHWARSC